MTGHTSAAAFDASHGLRLLPEPTLRAFTEVEYDERLAAFRRSMAEEGVELAVITAPDTMAWLTGYRSRWYRQHTSTALPPAQCTVVHVSDGEPFVIEAGYHEELVRETSVVRDIRALPTDEFQEAGLDEYVAFLAEQIRPWHGAVIGLERWSCIPSPAVSDAVEDMMRANGSRIVDVSLPVRKLRRLKSPSEIALIERAQAACDAGIRALVSQVTPETTELEAWALYSLGMVRAGGEPAALHETVAAGASISAVHRLSSQVALGSGPVFHPDMAAAVHGYHARATRPVTFGRPSDAMRRQAEAAAGAYEVVARHGTVGTPWTTLMNELRVYWAKSGIEGGNAGYELGVSIPPADWVNEFVWSIDAPPDGVIEAGLVTNFETFAEVFLCDTIVFEDSGPRFLSTLPREVLVA